MLQEMGVHVWLPESGVAVLERAAVAQAASPRASAPSPVPIAMPVAPARGAQPLPVAPTAPTMPAKRPAAAPTPEPVGPLPATALRMGQDSVSSSPDWQALSTSVQSCQACALCAGRSHTTLVAPVSAVACDWMILGDPPDEDEDRAGASFAGQDGALLANMLRALGLQRANPLPGHTTKADSANAAATPARRAYVSNVLKCRPAHGAMAQAAELNACSAWLQREIALVQPKVIVSMGRFANQLLLGEAPALAALPLGKLRGTVHRYQGHAVVVSYPPKLLMRNGADKAKAWADLCLAASTLDSAA